MTEYANPTSPNMGTLTGLLAFLERERKEADACASCDESHEYNEMIKGQYHAYTIAIDELKRIMLTFLPL